jgi:hypothetical protein
LTNSFEFASDSATGGSAAGVYPATTAAASSTRIIDRNSYQKCIFSENIFSKSSFEIQCIDIITIYNNSGEQLQLKNTSFVLIKVQKLLLVATLKSIQRMSSSGLKLHVRNYDKNLPMPIERVKK